MSEPRYELQYFPARGRAEPIRLLFAAAQVPFTDIPITDWPASRSQTPLGQLPVLIEHSGDGSEFRIPQSGAIMRHLARRFDLYGKTERQKTMADYIADTTFDWRDKFVPIQFAAMMRTSEEALAKYWDNLPQTLAVFERLLGQSTQAEAGFFVGESVTYADIAVFEILDSHLTLRSDCLESFPVLKAFVARMHELPGIAEYLKNRHH
jgi:glutathione S-transferase